MAFEKKVPQWNAAGSEPPDSLKNKGFVAGYKPPADYFNWFWHSVSEALKELQAMKPNDIGAASESVVNKTYSVATSEDIDNVLNTVLADMEQHSMREFEISFTAAIQPFGGGTFLCKMFKVSDSYSLVEMRVYATTSPKTWTRSLFAGVWKDWVYLTNSAELSALQALVDGKYDRLAAYKEDADTTLIPVILTNTGTLPTNEFWCVHTTFFGTVSETSARKQVAYGYTQNKVYTRRYYEGVWSDWTVVYTGDNKPTPAEIGAAKIYVDVATLGLSPSTATPLGIFNKMEDNSIGLFAVGTDWNADAVPTQYGTLFVARRTNSRAFFLFEGVGGTYQTWMGTLNTTDGVSFSGWRMLYDTTNKPSASDIGAAAASHTHGAANISSGTFMDTNVKAKTGTDYGTARLRNIYAGTSDMTAGSSSLENGALYFVYE